MNRLDFLTMREQVMENIDSIVDEFTYNLPIDDVHKRSDLADELVTQLCDMVCETMDPAGLS